MADARATLFDLGSCARVVAAVGVLQLWQEEAVEMDRDVNEYLGRAVQIDPMKYMLNAPGTKRLKLNYDVPLSRFAFKFGCRRYTWRRSSRWTPGSRRRSPSSIC